MSGARAVHASILEKFPNSDISISIVWIHMLENDSKMSAKKAAVLLADARVRHFYDPEQRSGKAIAKKIGAENQVAWDFYLFYSPGKEWIKEPPRPIKWMHQLRESWADQKHFYTGEDLPKMLFQYGRRLIRHD